MQLGFGAYRISKKSKAHREALQRALDLGIRYIDTSANYTDGESEELIGELLADCVTRPIVITKAGYIQGQNLERLAKLEQRYNDLEVVEFDGNLKHSIDPRFLRDQIEQSLKRLQMSSLDVFLLHNPEYYLKKNPHAFDEYYLRLQKAFAALRKFKEEGLIKSYGVSSNTLVTDEESSDYTDFERLYRCAQDAQALEGFNYLQFPFNLLELGALKSKDGTGLIQKAQGHGLTTIGNRPFNAFSSSGLLRLANYPVDLSSLNDEKFSKAMDLLEKEWTKSDFHRLPLVRQFTQLWNTQQSLEACEQIFFDYFFPFVAQVYGRNLSAEESQPFYDLFESAKAYTLSHMNQRAETFQKQAQAEGLLPHQNRTLELQALDQYAQYGIDIVLVGMRRISYVDQLKAYF